MKRWNAIWICALGCVTLVMSACDRAAGLPADSAFSTGEQPLLGGVACLALEPGSGETFTEVDASEAGARATAREECEAATGAVCVVQRCWESTFHGEGTDIFGPWACIAEEPKTLDLFCERGEDLRAARQNALEACRQETARTCTIRRCFPAS